MAAPATTRVSYAEYLAVEAASAVRHAYVAGTVVAMAGGTIEHGRLIAQMQYLLRGALAGKPCVVLASDVRVRIRAAERATYPDIFVVCGELQRDPEDPQAVINPQLVIEVLSESTALTDREAKNFDYRRLPSVSEYVLISQRTPSVEVFRRSGPRRWTVEEVIAGERVVLASIGAELAVDEIYRDGLGAILATAPSPNGA
ncbi:MAG TPA: Uma2 family endonuclease [Kofleriaceae bacterium]|nr:Uma2 family endonuclease [Kofleriaceae bacterium]